MSNQIVFIEKLGAKSRRFVIDKHRQSVNVQNDNQEIFNGKEDQHLVYHVKVHHNCEPDDQERSILDKQSFYSAPDVCPEVVETWRSFRVVLGRRVDYWWEMNGKASVN